MTATQQARWGWFGLFLWWGWFGLLRFGLLRFASVRFGWSVTPMVTPKGEIYKVHKKVHLKYTTMYKYIVLYMYTYVHSPTRVPFFSRGVGVGSLLRVHERVTMYICTMYLVPRTCTCTCTYVHAPHTRRSMISLFEYLLFDTYIVHIRACTRYLVRGCTMHFVRRAFYMCK